MPDTQSIDGVLVQWGDRLFYPANRVVRARPDRPLRMPSLARRAATIRERIAATVVRRAPQVMVKVTGGGRGMKSIAAHFRYISKHGRLEIEDERGQTTRGRGAVASLVEEWRYSGSHIGDESERREAFNIMLSMPSGTDPLSVQWAAREFAKAELADDKYVLVLHDHQANPHVHICVRAESKHGNRLNPRKADLQRWRETFAQKLRERGIDAEATRQATRGVARRYPALWQVKAGEDGRLRKPRPNLEGAKTTPSRNAARDAWAEIAAALQRSADPGDRQLAEAIRRFTREATRTERVPDATRRPPNSDTPRQIDAPDQPRR